MQESNLSEVHNKVGQKEKCDQQRYMYETRLRLTVTVHLKWMCGWIKRCEFSKSGAAGRPSVHGPGKSD